MHENFYKKILEESSTGYTYHKIIYNEDHVTTDYEFIEVNAAFEKFTGVMRSNIVGKKVSEIIRNTSSSRFNLLKFCEKILINADKGEFEQYSESLNRWFRVNTYSPQPNYFITFFIDISSEKTKLFELENLRREKEKREGELIIANVELAFQNEEKEKRAEELILANKELAFQNDEKEKRALDFAVMNTDLEEEITVRQQAEKEVEKLNKELENKVIERTNQLQDINETLEEEISGKISAENMYLNEINLTEAIFNSVQGIIYLYDDENRLVRWNKEHQDLTGYSSEELYKMNILDWFKGDEKSQNAVLDIITRNIKGGIGVAEANLQKKDGTTVPMYFTVSVLNLNGKQYFTGIGIDLTERKLAEDAVKSSEEKYRMLTENASDVISVYNLTKGKFTYSSPSMFYLRGLTEEEAINERLEEALTPESFVSISEFFARTIKDFIKEPNELNNYINEVQQPCKNGDVIWVELSTKYRYSAVGDIETVIVSRNIKERKKAEEEILYLSYHDQLTGLYNRRFYEEELKRIDTGRNLPITIVMADINGLKLINDSFGHAMGDELLKKTAEVIKKGCRIDDIIARLGGDEFVIILPKTDAIETEKVMKRIKVLAIEQTVGPVELSISFGYETKNSMEEKIQDILKITEDNMYRHKLNESSTIKSKTIDLIMNTLFEKSNREMLHSKRVSKICEHFATILNFDEVKINQLTLAGLMHDIGKVGIKNNILNKSRTLNKDEWIELKRHPEIGYRILSSVNEFSEIADYVLEHQERWDGKGYPKGLKGEGIKLQSRIIAIADAYDAMTSNRSYRAALPKKVAIKELKKYAGVQFDPELVSIFIEDLLG